MKFASWNVNSLNIRLAHLQKWCASSSPDVIALQETKMENRKFPINEIENMGFYSVFSGQKSYNGVALLSRQPLHDIVMDIPGLEDPQRRILAATMGNMRIINLYVVNGQEVGSEKYAYKLHWLEKVTEFLREELQHYPCMIVLGDFNIAPEDRDVHDPDIWREHILCSTPEREALRKIFDLGLHDTFRLFNQDAGQFSWWDYRQAALRRNLGLRIDLVLASNALKSYCTNAMIDLIPRRWERPSDHAPCIVEINHAG